MVTCSLALPEICFGSRVRLRLPALLPPGPVLIVCGKHSRRQIETELIPALRERAVEVVSVSAEIPLSEVASVVETGKRLQAKSVVGWGGGSAMDAAKAAAALLDEPYPVEEYFYQRRTASPRKTFLALLPTTAGTGAEVTVNAVLHDEKTTIKQSLRTPGMQADLALVDPELLYHAPAAVTAASGFDALTQALEGFVSRKANALTRQLSLTAASLILSSLADGCQDDPQALEKLARGSLLAGIAFSTSGLGAVHGIGHPMGSVLHLSHGVSCAALLVPVMEFNAARAPELFQELAQGLNYPAIEALISEIWTLRNKLGLPGDLRSAGLSEKQYPFIVANCRSGSMRCNPVDCSDEEVISILRRLS